MLRYESHCSAPPAVAWALIARPALWHRWAPHLRGAWGLGQPEVEVGARGAARLLGVVPVPARIASKEAGRSWVWRVGGVVEMDHRVEPGEGADRCMVAVTISAPAPLELALRASYGPLVALLVQRLARVAQKRAADGGALPGVLRG